MKIPYCEHEQAVAAAVQSGSRPEELLAHAHRCPLCAEVLFIAGRLKEDMKLAELEFNALPVAALVWRKAQFRAREEALAKATLPIRIVRTCALALAVLAAPWLVVSFSRLPAWMPNLGFRHLLSMHLDGNWLAAFTGTTLLGITATFLCIGLSSWYMLREK